MESNSATEASENRIDAHNNEKNRISFNITYLEVEKKVKKLLEGKIGLVGSILLIIVATAFSVTLKFLASSSSTSAAARAAAIVFVVLYYIVFVTIVIEMLLRIISNRVIYFFWEHNKGPALLNILEFAIVVLDFIVNIIALHLWSSTGKLNSVFGSIITLRLLLRMIRIPSLKQIVNGVKNSFWTIVFCYIFLLVLVYGWSLLAYILFSPELFSSNESCEICKERFYSIETSFFAMFQVLTGENWAEGIARPLGNHSVIRKGALLFFSLFSAVMSYLFLNILFAVIIEAIIEGEDDYFEEDPTKKRKAPLWVRIKNVVKYRILKLRPDKELQELDIIDLDEIVDSSSIAKKWMQQQQKKEEEKIFRAEANFLANQMIELQKSIREKMNIIDKLQKQKIKKNAPKDMFAAFIECK